MIAVGQVMTESVNKKDWEREQASPVIRRQHVW